MAPRKLVAGLFALFFIAISVYFLSPIVGAIVWSARLRSYVKVKLEHPSCTPDKRAAAPYECDCEFAFEGVRSTELLSFDTSLHKTLDSGTRTYSVSGTGSIQSGKNRVMLTADHVAINDTDLPIGKATCHILIQRDGHLVNSRIDIAW